MDGDTKRLSAKEGEITWQKHVVLFAGTTEGRILANWLDEQSGVTGIVCVATEYGAELLEEEMSLKHLTVHCGRLDEGEMEAF